MKQVLLLFCIIGMAVLKTQAATSNSPEPVQPFTAVDWTTTTLHSPSGKATVFTRRTVYTRDASGTMRREIYEPTKGLQHDMTAALERVLTSPSKSSNSSLAQRLPTLRSSKEPGEQDVDLGTSQFSGLPTTGRRQTFKDVNGQSRQTLETWFCATLGVTVRMESVDANGDTVASELSELHFGNPDSASSGTAPVATPPIPLLTLYRALFTQIAHMERDRQANDPGFHVNMVEIEDQLRKKMSLSPNQWQVLVDKSVNVESYTRERSREARSFADQDRAARRDNPLGANTLVAGRAKLHQMQLNLNTHVEGEIEELKATVGAGATDRIQAYLQGPLAASTSVVSFKSVQARAQKEQAR